jgi:hypothetical protein
MIARAAGAWLCPFVSHRIPRWLCQPEVSGCLIAAAERSASQVDPPQAAVSHRDAAFVTATPGGLRHT